MNIPTGCICLGDGMNGMQCPVHESVKSTMSLPTLVRLYAAYQAPGRYYHNINHISECFTELYEAIKQKLVDNEEAMRWAIWFHDYIYDTIRADGYNEERSATAAVNESNMQRYDTQFANTVRNLILVTKHDPEGHPTATRDEQLMCDIDLAGLAADNFSERTEWIRKEYSHVPDEDFYPARKQFLKRFLERKFIYYTKFFREKYEAKARANLLKATA